MLSNLKKLLIKKAFSDSNILYELNKISDDSLTSMILESLEKMGEGIKTQGTNPNKTVHLLAGDIASTYEPGKQHEVVKMIRDALAHHISHHKANLKAGFRESADAHLNKIIPLMHLVTKLGQRVPEAIGLRYVDPRPWEVNYRTPLTRKEAFDMGLRRPIKEGKDSNEFHNGTKGLGARPSKSVKSDWSNLRDYRYLEMRPHPHRSMWSTKINKQPWDTEGYEGGYPFEEIRVGGEEELSAGGGYLPIKEVEASKAYRPHVFDLHPINKFMDIDANKLTPEQEQAYVNAASSWHDNPEHQKWLDELMANMKDPNYETYLADVSKTKPPHHFDGLELADHPKHAKIFVDRWGKSSSTEEQKSQQEKPEDTSKINWDLLPEALRQKHEKKAGSSVQTTAQQEQKPNEDINWDLLPEALRQKHKK